MSGVPQGSAIAPMLFILFINDLAESINCPTALFADDLKLWQETSDMSEESKCMALQNEINACSKWSTTWGLPFAPSKCKLVQLGNRNQLNKYTMPGGGSLSEQLELEISHGEKDLGVLVYSNLTFKEHIASKVKTANQMMGIIKQAFTVLDKQMFLSLYKSLVRPHLEYAQAAWSPCLQGQIDELERVQRRATKIVPGLHRLSYVERLQMLKLPTLVYRRLRGDMIEVYKILHHIYDPEVTKNLLPSASSHNLRGNTLKIYHQQCNSSIRHNFFALRVAKPWNSLPDYVCMAPSVNSFKSRLDSHWERQELVYNYRSPLSYSSVTLE